MHQRIRQHLLSLVEVQSGCDSIVTLNLTINNVVTGTDVQTACNSYTWIDGITYNASTNTPTFTIVGGSSTGCDSIVTLDLTINNFVQEQMFKQLVTLILG
jgi:hypothetical protein